MQKNRFAVRAPQVLSAAISTVVLLSLVLCIPANSYAAKKKKEAADAGKAAAALIDLNSADQKTLESLPGVGKATAQAIIAGRPYKSVDDLKRVKGMSDKKINAIRGQVTVGAAAAPAAAAPAAAQQAAGAAEKASSARKAASGSAEKSTEKAKGKLAPGQRVNINTASKEELEALPGVGPVKAQAIIAGRPYEKPEDIMKVKGIKQKSFEKIQDMITVR